MEENYHVKSFPNATSLNQEIKKENPDLILLEAILPVADIQKVCKILDEREETDTVPILLMAGPSRKICFKAKPNKKYLAKWEAGAAVLWII